MATHPQSNEQYQNIYKTITESINLPVFSVDTEYRYTSFNRVHAEQMKSLYYVDIQIGRNILEYYPLSSDRKKVKLNIDKALQGKHHVDEASSGESTNRIYYEVIHDPVYDDSGNIIGAAFVGRDITNYRNAQDKLNETIQNYNTVFQTSPNAIVVTDRNGIVRIWNDAAEQIFGWKKEQTVGNYAGFIPHDKSEEANAVRSRILSGETIKGFETVRQDKEGRRIDVRFSASPFRDSRNQINGIIAIIENISRNRAVEIQLQTIMDNMLEGCQIIGYDWKYKYLNEAAVNDCRMDRSELINHTLMECFPEIEKTMIFSVLKECMEKRQSRRIFNEFVYNDKSRGYFNISISPVEQGLFLLTLDVTEQIKAEQQIKLNEERFRQTFESANVGKSITLPDGKIQVNKALSSMLGYSSEELNGMRWQDITPADEIPWIEKLIEENLNNKKDSARFEKSYIHKTGKTVVGDVSIRAIYNSDGRIEFFITTVIDITEKKVREHEIRKLNETLEQKIAERTAEVMDLYNNSPCGYHSLNKEGVFEMVNDTELRWLGYERDDLINKMKATDILTPKSQETFCYSFPKFIKTGYLTDLELDFIRKDGSILSVLLNATAVYDLNGGFLRSRSTVIDHTARKHAEESLRRALKRLEESNKELESFSYSVSHDLRAPLRAINGFTQILREDYSPRFDEEGKRICDVIQHNSDMMGRPIDDLLAFSRFGRSEMNKMSIPMHRIVQSVIDDLITLQLKKRTEIVMGELPEVKIDPSLIKQVWVNLVSNAVKYSSGKEQTRIEIYSVIQDDRIVFSIKDNGIGFDMLYVDKLFGVFQRLHTETEFEGTGVGLAIVKRIVNRHGGDVWAESRSGEGSVFSFSIPK
jgi:PAS domain S-box-containing protein